MCYALGRGFVGAGACGLRASFGWKVFVNGYGCRAALWLGVGARVDQDGVPALFWLGGPIGQALMLILVLVRQWGLLDCLQCVLWL